MARKRHQPSVGEAIRLAYQTAGMTQTELAVAVGVDQGTISRWTRDEQAPDVHDLAAIDKACGRPLGSVLREAGLVAEVITVPEAINADMQLTRDAREMLVVSYETALRVSQRRSHNGTGKR